MNGSKALFLLGALLPSSLAAQEFDLGVRVPPRAQASAVPKAGKPPKARPGATAQFNAPATVVPTVPLEEAATDDAFATVGRGFDPITGRILDIECVVGTEPDWVMPAGASKTRSNYDVASNDRAHQSVSSSSVSISAVIKVVTIGFGTSSSSANAFNGVDMSGRLYSRIATKGVERRNVKWSPRAEWLLRNDLPNFLKQCGTRYVRAVYAGHLFDDTVTSRLRQEQSGVSSATSLSLGFKKIFGVGAAFADAQTELNRIADTRVEHDGRGTLAVPPAPTGSVGPVENEFSYYNTGFLAAVKTAPTDSTLPLYIEADRYVDKDRLTYLNRIPTWSDRIISAVLSKTDTYNDLITAISDLRYALTPGPVDRLTFYKGVTAQDAQDRMTAAQTILVAFQDAVTTCQTLSTTGVELPTPGNPAVDRCQKTLDDALTPAKVSAVLLPRAF